MPELPEVENLRRTLARELSGRRIAEVTHITWERSIAEPAPDLFRELLRDRPVLGVDRRAKYLIVHLNRDEALVVHLRMSGQLTLQHASDELDSHVRVAMRLDDGRRLFFRDQRKFGRLWLLDSEGLRALAGKLGPEPLDEALTAEEFRTLLRRRKGRLKPLLLDQKLIAGIGNIYADEVLWHARLHPLCPVSSLDNDQIERLYGAIRSVLSSAIQQRGTTFSSYRDATGEPGGNQEFLNAYGRAGKPCPRCGRPIERTVVAQRSTYFCPSCQPPPTTHA